MKSESAMLGGLLVGWWFEVWWLEIWWSPHNLSLYSILKILSCSWRIFYSASSSLFRPNFLLHKSRLRNFLSGHFTRRTPWTRSFLQIIHKVTTSTKERFQCLLAYEIEPVHIIQWRIGEIERMCVGSVRMATMGLLFWPADEKKPHCGLAEASSTWCVNRDDRDRSAFASPSKEFVELGGTRRDQRSCGLSGDKSNVLRLFIFCHKWTTLWLHWNLAYRIFFLSRIMGYCSEYRITWLR